jgi:Concanavalin A-like lectin/glucanases superfamily/Secretion system C-terminal sorting domain
LASIFKRIKINFTSNKYKMKKFFTILMIFCLFNSAKSQCNNWLKLPTVPSSVKVGDLDISGNQITVEATINRDALLTPVGFSAIDVVSKHSSQADVNYLLRPNSAEITTTNGYYATPLTCETQLNKTYHIAMVYNGSSLKFYRNGFLMNQIAATGNLILNNWQTSIGLNDPQVTITNFLGYINEVRIWNVARTQTELQTYMNSGLPSPTTQVGLKGYYAFDNLLNKQGTAAFNGTINGSATINATNPNCSFLADSCAIAPPICNSGWLSMPQTSTINDFVSLGDVNLSSSTSLTIEASFYCGASFASGGANSVNLVSKHQYNTDNNCNYLLRTISAEIQTSNGFFATPINCDFIPNRINHVAMVYNGSTLSFYRNGFLISSIPATGSIQNNPSLLTKVGNKSGNNIPSNPVSWEPFRGFINEVRIWNVARTQTQIVQYRNASLPTPNTQSGLVAYYQFSSLNNLQGNATYNGSIAGAATINAATPNCTFIADSCASVPPPNPCTSWLKIPSYNTVDGVRIGDLDITGNQITVEANFNADEQYFIPSTVSRDLVSKHTNTNDCNYLLRPVSAEITTSTGFHQVLICDYLPQKVNHAALVYDGVALKFYRNGYLMGSKPVTGNLATNDLITKLGNSATGSANGALKGYMNEVRIWNVARTQSQIQTYMNSTLPNPTTQIGLKGYYVFDNLLNKQGNAAFNGTINGAASLNATIPNCTFIADSCAVIACPNNIANTIQKCSNQNIALVPRAGGTSYSWSPATGLSSTNVQSPICSVNTNTTYIVTLFNSLTNCTFKDTIYINVNTPSTVNFHPTPVSVCNGNIATFTAAGTGTGTIYQWQSAPTIAGPFTNVTSGTGFNSGTYTTIATTPSMNGTYYQMLVTTSVCPAVVTSNAAQLTINTIANITTQPSPQAVCTPQPATFSVAATGTGLTYQWQVSTVANPIFTNIVGATSSSFTTAPTSTSMNGNQYRVNILSTCSPTVPLVSSAAILTINNTSIAQQPIQQSGCAGDGYTFSITTTSIPPSLTYQWQSSPNGLPGTFTNITGANTSTYTINNAPIILNGYYFRVYISALCGSAISSDTSNAVKLMLSSRIAIVLTTPYTSNYNAAVNSGIYATVSPVGNYTYTWKRNGVIMPNTLTSKFILLNIDDEASYELSIVDSNTNCFSKSNIIKTNAKTSDNLLLDHLFFYPNPASNFINVRFNNSNISNRNTILNIYDNKGARVYTKAYTILGTFGNMRVDITNLPSQTYVVYLMDNYGKKLAGGKFVKVR